MSAIDSATSTSWLMVTSSSEPRLIGSVARGDGRVPLTQSSTNMNERVCSPSPQISIECRPLASATLRQMAAGAFSRPPSRCRVGHTRCGSARRGWSGRSPPGSGDTCARRRASPSRSHPRAWPGTRPTPSAGSRRQTSACRRRHRRRRNRRAVDACRLAALSMWVLISTESMQSALLCSMKPMPPISQAKL